MNIPVYYPEGGKHFMLSWNTHYDGNHVMLARSLSSLKVMSEALFHKMGVDVTFSIKYIEMVQPTETYSDLVFQKELLRRADSFFYRYNFYIVDRMKEKGLQSFGPFTLCKVSCNDKYHGCENCKNGLVIENNKSVLDIYKEYGSSYQDLHTKNLPLKTSKARVICSGEQMMVAEANFGHHAPGIEHHNVDETNNLSPDNLDFEGLVSWNDNLFFYICLQDIEIVQELLKIEQWLLGEQSKIACALQEKARAAKKERNDSYLLEAKEEWDMLCSIFGENKTL